MQKVDKSLIITVIVLIIYYILHYIVTNSFPPCLINKYTGFFCPGCGITRMVLSIITLNFYQAFRYNAFLFILFLLTIIYQIIKLITKQFSTKELKLNNYVYITILIAAIGFGIIRNLPAFSYLIPTIVK